MYIYIYMYIYRDSLYTFPLRMNLTHYFFLPCANVTVSTKLFQEYWNIFFYGHRGRLYNTL